MATKKKPARKMNFLKRVQQSAKVKSVRKKILVEKRKLKKLSGDYKRAVKSEARRMSR